MLTILSLSFLYLVHNSCVDLNSRGCKLCFSYHQAEVELEECRHTCDHPSRDRCTNISYAKDVDACMRNCCGKKSATSSFTAAELNTCLEMEQKANEMMMGVISSAVLFAVVVIIIYGCYNCECKVKKSLLALFSSAKREKKYEESSDSNAPVKRQIEVASEQSSSLQAYSSPYPQLKPSPQAKSPTCSICNQGFTNAQSHCQHHFHLSCFNAWIGVDHKCPLCFQELYHSFLKLYCGNCENQLQFEEIISGNMIIKQTVFCWKCAKNYDFRP